AWSSPRPAYRGEVLDVVLVGAQHAAPLQRTNQTLLSFPSCSLPWFENTKCPLCGEHRFLPSRIGAFVFVHLHCHSHYSFLRGVASPEEIIAAAVAQKMPAVALTDTNGLYAAVPFYQAAKSAGVKPIVGVVIDVEFRVLHFASRN